MLDEKDLMLALKRHWDYAGTDEDIAHEIYHDDAVLEFPQSGERFEGVENFREWRRQHPAHLSMHTRRITHRDDLVVGENLISYDGAPWMYSVSLLEFRGNKVAHERIYIMDGWEAAEWRAPWRANTPADPPPPPAAKPLTKITAIAYLAEHWREVVRIAQAIGQSRTREVKNLQVVWGSTSPTCICVATLKVVACCLPRQEDQPIEGSPEPRRQNVLVTATTGLTGTKVSADASSTAHQLPGISTIQLPRR